MTATDKKPSYFGSSITLFHVVVVTLSLLLTISAWQFAKYQIETRTETRFNTSRDFTLGLITERMRKYEDALWAGVAAMQSHGGDIGHEDWHIFARSLKIDEKYPGINGIGVIDFLDEESLPSYLARQRQERPGFAVHPAHEQQLKMPITLIEPAATNAAAIGLDVAHEINRRTAALASRDTGAAQITGPIVLVQVAGSTAGFLFYAPYYRGETPTTLAERQSRAAGAVYAPFVVRKLMEGLLAKGLRDVRFSISDDGQMIYDEHTADDPSFDPNPMFTDQISLDLYGRTWTLDVRSDLAFRGDNSYTQPTFILIAGLLIEMLIVALLFLMSRANHRAISYADKVTRALKRKTMKLAESNETLACKNAELEQFAYVTSHDLKTPIRGIGGLTEMIEEDLEPYFATPDANPDVGLNLQRIHERVRRMIDLTRGVMEFSQVGLNDGSSEPLALQDVIEALRLDFDLAADQLRLIGDVAVMNRDTFNLRRVLENLVGNAVKYHEGEGRLEIHVSALADGDRCRISVSDNGPGIDPKYHAKIFDVFQTLRTGDTPESTGIGLAIVKKAVSVHRGLVAVNSSVGEGAEFRFDWPLDAASTDLATAKAA